MFPSGARNLPQNHIPYTDSPDYRLCDPCAEHFNLCARCLGPLSGYGLITVPTDKWHCVVGPGTNYENDSYVTHMFVGQQILALMSVDLFSRKVWKVKRLVDTRLAFQRFVWAGGQYAWQEMYFDLLRQTSNAEIEIEEGYNSWGWWMPPPPTGQKVPTYHWTIEVLQ
jgi:hypothetical protein